jgi:hypothetical protein
MRIDHTEGVVFRDKDLSFPLLTVSTGLADVSSIDPLALHPMFTSFEEFSFLEFYQPAGAESNVSRKDKTDSEKVSQPLRSKKVGWVMGEELETLSYLFQHKGCVSYYVHHGFCRFGMCSI